MITLPAGAFLAMEGTAWGAIVEPCNAKSPNEAKSGIVPGSTLLIWPYWYLISTDETLKLLGKSCLTWSDVYEEQAKPDEVLNDLFKNTDTTYSETEGYALSGFMYTMFHASLPKPDTFYPTGPLHDIEVGDYIGMLGHLYCVEDKGQFKPIGKLSDAFCTEAFNTSAFIKDLARLTGVIAVDVESLQPEGVEEILKRMRQKLNEERFSDECNQLFGLPLQRATQD